MQLVVTNYIKQKIVKFSRNFTRRTKIYADKIISIENSNDIALNQRLDKILPSFYRLTCLCLYFVTLLEVLRVWGEGRHLSGNELRKESY